MKAICRAGACAFWLGLLVAMAGQSDPSARITVNRTLPKVQPPRTTLEFSAQPTTEEISRARVFEEPLVPIGGEPNAEENAALAAALLGYARRSGLDDFASLEGFLAKYPQSPWGAALLTDLGLEYYNTAHYSLALDAWKKAWAHAKDAEDAKGNAIADRAVGELAYMYARLGRMTELEALLKSVENRVFVGAATEKITGAREGLWNMQHKPEISFKCGPYALQRILLSDQRLSRPAGSSPTNALMEIFNFPSTQKGVSLPQVAELSKKVGLNLQMAFLGSVGTRSTTSPDERDSGTRWNASLPFVVPSVVHWKVGHYAAMVRQEGDKYLLEDPTFGNTVWATRQALEAETSGYFLIPSGELPRGWRSVDDREGASVWGKGATTQSDPGPTCCHDHKSGGGKCKNANCPPLPNPIHSRPHLSDHPAGPDFFQRLAYGSGMAVSDVHLMVVSLNIVDTPVGYTPPVGPPVQFTVRYSQRDAFQPANFTYSNFGPKWTCDWISYITDNPSNTLADVTCYMMGGGTRTFTGFNSTNQTFGFQQFDQTLLKRTGASSCEMTWPDGSKLLFSQPDGSSGTSRKIFLTQLVDPFGNTVSLIYDGNLRLAAITDAIGQVTTLMYGNTNDLYEITRVTDPFGRFADFAYDSLGRLTNITDVIGLTSRFVYTGSGDFINSLITPYGTNTYIAGGGSDPTTRSLETTYADGSRDRVEFNQSVSLGNNFQEPVALLPMGMIVDSSQSFRNTFYWSRTACASSYGDYSKASVYHWVHKLNVSTATTSGTLGSLKEPLENRVYYNYPGQLQFNTEGTSTRPTKIGRVLDDGQTQLYTYACDGFGHVTNSIDPIGRTFSYLYASNGIDLLEVRQTHQGNDLLFRATYNSQHLPLTTVGADGQTNSFTYNSRGQLLTETDPKGETTSYTYDTNGYLIAVDGPLPGTNDMTTATYDALGRTRTKTDVSGYTLTFDHDDMDRLTKITHPDGTFAQFFYNRLDMTNVTDRAGRQTTFEYDSLQQMKKKTDPLGRVTLFDWCRCGSLKSLTDPMGRTTSWLTDVQERPVAKVYGDGSQVHYVYENASSRLRQVLDEKQQISQFAWNLDDTIKSVGFANATITTPGVTYDYDPNYSRLTSMTDGTGTTLYSYNPVASSPMLGANQLASVDGPLPNDTITYTYDELGRAISTAINGVATRIVFDEAGRVVSETNALGTFAMAYDGSTGRMLTNTFPNGQTVSLGYGNVLQDLELQRITHKVGAAPISGFLYGHDLLTDRITTWSQQAGAASPSIFTFRYDTVDQLISATVTNAGTQVNNFAYAYDLVANRLIEQVGTSIYTATFNALNQINTTTPPGASRTNEWDAKDRLVAVVSGNQRTEFTYDGESRLASVRKLVNNSEVSFRRFLWCGNALCEERDPAGVVTKRFFPQGVKVETGPNVGSYFYTRDHLGSVRELIDSSSNVRARYAYDPFGRRSKLAGDLDADFGFAGLFFASEAGLSIARFRAYDADLGRWLSRDPMRKPEMKEGPNLYAYVHNNPANRVDPLGLCCEAIKEIIENRQASCPTALTAATKHCARAARHTPDIAASECAEANFNAYSDCYYATKDILKWEKIYLACMETEHCEPPEPCSKPWRLPMPNNLPKCDELWIFGLSSEAIGGACRP